MVLQKGEVFWELFQVDEFPGVVVEQGGVEAFYAGVFQVDTGIEIEGYDGLLPHEKFFGLSEYFEALGGRMGEAGLGQKIVITG